jgi:dimethylargininase
LARSGYRVTTLATREIAKIDAGLSCMSLRWRG